jgi:heme exporter protein B
MILYELHQLRLQGGTILASLSFFAISLFCISVAFGSEVALLRRIAPAFLWILAILTTLFSTPLLLKSEVQMGLLDEVLLQPFHPAFYLMAKMGAQTLLLGMPLIILGVLFASLLSLAFAELIALLFTLLIGFPALSALGLLGGLLTLNARGGGLLLVFLILPLTLPLLLFALSVMEMTRLGLDSSASFCLLTSTSLLLVILAMGIGSWALRFVGEE